MKIISDDWDSCFITIGCTENYVSQLTVILCIAHNFFFRFVNAFVYYGLTQNTNELAGNPFVNFALYGFLEIPAYLLTILALKKLSRRNIIGGSMIFGGVACFVSYLLPSGKYNFLKFARYYREIHKTNWDTHNKNFTSIAAI